MNLSDVKQSKVGLFNAYFHKMLAAGIYLAPSAYESNFVSCVHGDIEIEKTLQVFAKAL